MMGYLFTYFLFLGFNGFNVSLTDADDLGIESREC